MTEQWTYHRAYPYGKHERQRRQLTLLPTPAAARDSLRRPLMKQPSEWPQCSEGMYNLPEFQSGSPPKSLAATINGTFRPQELPSSSGWKARAATPLWQPRSQTPRLQTAGYEIRRSGEDVPPWMAPVDPVHIKQSRAALASQQRAAEERKSAHPTPLQQAANGKASSLRLEDAPHRAAFTQFIHRRPDAARTYIKEALPAYNEAVGALNRADAERSLKRETDLINRTHSFYVEIGLSPRLERKAAPAKFDPLAPGLDWLDDDVAQPKMRSLREEMDSIVADREPELVSPRRHTARIKG